jgi:hypothetical protein
LSFVIFWDTFRSPFSLFCLCFILHLLRLFLIVHCTDIFSVSFGSLGPPYIFWSFLFFLFLIPGMDFSVFCFLLWY